MDSSSGVAAFLVLPVSLCLGVIFYQVGVAIGSAQEKARRLKDLEALTSELGQQYEDSQSAPVETP